MGWDCFPLSDTSINGRKSALKEEVTPICKRVRANKFVSDVGVPTQDEFYAACELKDKFADYEGQVIGLVGLGRIERESYCVKRMPESVAPYYYRAGDGVLDALTDPAPNETGKEWRRRCRDWIENVTNK